MVPDTLARLIAPLHDLVRWLNDSRIPYAIVGGVAASFLGRARATRDIDLVVLIPEDAWEAFVNDADTHGFAPRAENALAFALKSRVLLLQHKERAVNVDVSLGAIAFEHQMIDRAISFDIEGMNVRLASPEDLIAMKSLAMRPQDVSDIESLLDAQQIDVSHVRRCVEDFAQTLESPDIADAIETLLQRRGL